jgi:hypothetical protein
MGLFRRKTPISHSQHRTATAVDNTLSDDEWLRQSEAHYETLVVHRWGSCETVASGGADQYGVQDFGTALFFYQKSIDMLHTQYLFGEMKHRQPSAADAWIIDGYTNSLGVSLDLHPNAPVADSVREVTHRLRTIASACERTGVAPNVYRNGLQQVAIYAPHVNVDDIFWH